jgi:hypothetical protein
MNYIEIYFVDKTNVRLDFNTKEDAIICKKNIVSMIKNNYNYGWITVEYYKNEMSINLKNVTRILYTIAE